VEFDNAASADRAIETLNGRELDGSQLKINRAYQTQQAIKSPDKFNVFVGDLSGEINDQQLFKEFSHFGSLAEARVMWDMSTGRSRGYGFVSFNKPEDAEEALRTMDGKLLGSRVIRCNWAQHHGGRGAVGSLQAGFVEGEASNGQPSPQVTTRMYEAVVSQTPSWHCTVYVGNIPQFTSVTVLLPIFQSLGYVVDFKYQPERGFAFVQYDCHERAALVIVQLTGFQIHGRILKVGWGKEKVAHASYRSPPGHYSRVFSPLQPQPYPFPIPYPYQMPPHQYGP
jgi:nucleolysin TIA-1/TIAR